MVEGCRVAWEAIGEVNYEREISESGSLVFRRSLYVVRDMTAGETFTPECLRSIRPGHGLAPKHLPDILASTAEQQSAALTACRSLRP